MPHPVNLIACLSSWAQFGGHPCLRRFTQGLNVMVSLLGRAHSCAGCVLDGLVHKSVRISLGPSCVHTTKAPGSVFRINLLGR